MPLMNTPAGYGIVSRLFHWIMALAIVIVFGLGVWMVRLDYQSPYYTAAPDFHRSLGILLLIALIARFAWRMINSRPADPELTVFEKRSSHAVHLAFYPLILLLTVSGYLISSANGEAVGVFHWFTVPAVVRQPGLEDQAGLAHRWIAYGTMALALVHTMAALKHHVIDKSQVLSRMWSGPRSN